MRKHFKLYILLINVILLGIIIYFVYINVFKSPISASIKSQLDFPALIFKNNENYKLDEKSIKYDSKEKLFLYTVQYKDNKITVTQQQFPEILIYDKFVNTFSPYSEIGTKIGKVTLARPKELKDNQAAVINYNNTTLIFARPEKDLSDDEWKTFFNLMEVVN